MDATLHATLRGGAAGSACAAPSRQFSQAAGSLIAAAPVDPGPRDPPEAADPDAIATLLAGLATLDRTGLRVAWRRHLRTPPPDHLPKPLFLRLLAYRLQARHFGDLDRETIRSLDRIAREATRRRKGSPVSRIDADLHPMPEARAAAAPRGLKPGTLIAREHAGIMHVVTVVAGGFLWNGVVHTSLSGIARQITGTRWNGPRFFGLRDRIARGSDTP